MIRLTKPPGKYPAHATSGQSTRTNCKKTGMDGAGAASVAHRGFLWPPSDTKAAAAAIVAQ
jgi:hypothetical protein